MIGPRVVLIAYDEISIFRDDIDRWSWHSISVIIEGSVGSNNRRDGMKIRINKLLRASLLKMVLAHANPEMVQEFEE